MVKILKTIQAIMMLPVRMAASGFRGLIEVLSVQKQLKLKKRRILIVSGNHAFDRPLEVKDDLFVADHNKEQLYFKNKNVYIDEDNNDLCFFSDGHPVSHDLNNLKQTSEVEESVVILTEKIDEVKSKLTYRRTIYTPIDIHQLDTLDRKEWSNLSIKVYAAKAFQFMEGTPKGDLILALGFGIIVGMFLAMSLAYWLK